MVVELVTGHCFLNSYLHSYLRSPYFTLLVLMKWQNTFVRLSFIFQCTADTFGWRYTGENLYNINLFETSTKERVGSG